MPDRLIRYVDGFNLYHGLRDRARHRLLWLDLVELANLLRPRSSLVRVHYFTAPVLDDSAAASALVVSADSDLSPAIHAVRRLQPSMFIAAAFPPKRYSAELKKWMPASFHIAPAKLNAAQLPPEVTDVTTGRTYQRPKKWN